MSFERSGIVALVAVSLALAGMAGQGAQAETGMTLKVTAVEGSDTIMVSGETFCTASDIAFTVTSEDNAENYAKLVTVDQITKEADGTFATEFTIGPPIWVDDGIYKITAKQGNSDLCRHVVEVDVRNGAVAGIITSESTNVETGLLPPGNPAGPNVAMPTGMQLNAAEFVKGSTMFTVSGETDRFSQDVTITVTSPNGNVVTVAQIAANLDGTFDEIITVGGSLWAEDGMYTVSATQGDEPMYTDSIQVDILDGTVVPEFGAIAALVLAVAIVSVIAVSARSRLGLVPRY